MSTNINFLKVFTWSLYIYICIYLHLYIQTSRYKIDRHKERQKKRDKEITER